MFNYIKETIINDINNVLVHNGTDLVVKRGGNYKISQILGGKVYRTNGVVGECATITIDPTKLGSYEYRQFTIFVKTPTQQLSDFALANWAEFGKPILLETSKTTASELVEVFKLAMQNDNPFYKVEVDSSKVKLTFAEPWMQVGEVNIVGVASDGTETDISKTSGLVVVTDNTPEFGTGKWLVENLRFPSYPNLRYNRLYADEAPAEGVVYDQFSFQYLTPRSVPGGLSAVDQSVDSITTHVFYVRHANADTFAGYFGGCTVETVTKGVDASASAVSALAKQVAANAEQIATNAAASYKPIVLEAEPGESTPGKVGDMAIYSGAVYVCVAIDTAGDTPSYTWQQLKNEE